MPIIDFNEIPRANIANGEQDTFELFARDFLSELGFRILSGPDRGQDGGRDIIIEEKRKGLMDITTIRWLVSCKHKSHSGQSVTDSDEQDISDRLRAHNCIGFIGFYSTIISSPLSRKLDSLKSKFEVALFDREKIESVLLSKPGGLNIIKRYFPISYDKIDYKRPSNLLSEYEPLRCVCCGKDLLAKDLVASYQSIVVFAKNRLFEGRAEGKSQYVDVYWSCKGECDRKMETMSLSNGCSTSWEDISDIVIPVKYLKWNMAILNRLRDGKDIYTDDAFEKLKHFIIAVSQIVLRNQTQEDIERASDLDQLPDWI